MASFITHYYMADEVAKLLEGKAKEIVFDNRNIYDTGCQGNDLLFYVFGRYRGYASITHNSRTYEMLISMCNYVKTTGREDLRAYLYGYMCHYALDSAIHPYVIYISGKHLPPYYPENLHKSLHLLLEGGIDYIITRDYLHKDPLIFAAADEFLHYDENVCACAADMTANAIDNVY
ncbi:MAG: zinc dependent phospholipase C family protein, partial [Clostridia bacterium]|nr:zinc dependent phospholipase C family protein [Clostridia bacterium]